MKDFFEKELDYNSYDKIISFDMIDELYQIMNSYEILVDKYQKYQKQVLDLSSDEKDEIKNSPRFKDIQEKLVKINEFHNTKHKH